MSKPIFLSEDFKGFNFLKFYKGNKSKKYIYRCLACYHIQQGKTYDYVSSLLHFNRNSVIDWVNRFNEFGIEGLLSIKKGRGRKTKLPYELEHDFKQNIILLQKNRDGGRITGYDIMDMVKKEFKVNYTISGIYNLLSRLNMSWVSARSIHPESNQQLQDEFKKTLQVK